MTQSANMHLKELGPAAFKLWVHLIKHAKKEGENSFSVVMSELAKRSGVVNEEGGGGLGPVHSALRRLVAEHYITATPDQQRRCRITLLRKVDIQ